MAITDNERPPYVTFEYMDVEDRAATQKNGYYSTKSVAFAIVTRPGSRDDIRMPAEEYIAKLRDRARKNEIPASWWEQVSLAYKMWKDGEELPPTGTPIKGWPVLSAAAQRDVLNAGIRTVEDLARMSDSELQNICTGALSFKQKAQVWLEAATGTGKIVEQMAQMNQQLAATAEIIRTQAAEIDRLRAFEPQPAPTPAPKSLAAELGVA